MRQNQFLMSNIFSTKYNDIIVVSILVSVYSHKHRADYTYSTAHSTYNTLHTTNKKSQMVLFLIAGYI